MKNEKMSIAALSLMLLFAGMILGSCGTIEVKSVLGTRSREIWFEEDQYDRENVPVLVKKNNEDFKILLFTDIQLESSPAKDRKSLELVDLMVKEINPHMIMTAGDNTSWRYADKMALKLIEQMEGYDIPWGVTLGNHDSEGRADRTWHGNQYENAENSIFSSGPSNIKGIGNYSVNIEDEEGNIIYTLVMLDSNVRREYEEGSDYDYIYEDQIKWYEWLINGVNSTENKTVPSMLIFHIPLPEFEDAWNAVQNGEVDSSDFFGENRESIISASVNTGLFDSALNLRSTTHIFCGHYHINNLSVNWKGIRLTYALKTGPTSYSEADMEGATLITIKAETNEVLVEHIYK